MKFKPTGSTEELGTVAVAFVHMPTDRTLLRSEPGIDKHNQLTQILGFIPDKLFQFVERPVIQFPVELVPSTFLHADLGQIFECEHGIRRLNYLLRDTVINVSHKPSFPTGHFTEFPFCRSGAFGLQFGSEMRVLCTNILHSLRIKKRVIRTHCDVHDTPVNAENRLFFNKIGGSGFYLNVKIKHMIVPVERQGRRLHQPQFVSPVILRDKERGSDPSVDRCKRTVSGFQINADYAGIVSHRRELFTERFNLTFHRLKCFTGTIPCALYQRGREIRNRLSNIPIGCRVVEYLAGSVVVKTPLGTGIERHGVISHGLQERVTAIGRYIKFQLDSPNHSHMLTVLGIKGNGGEADALPPLPEGRGLRAAFG